MASTLGPAPPSNAFAETAVWFGDLPFPLRRRVSCKNAIRNISIFAVLFAELAPLRVYPTGRRPESCARRGRADPWQTAAPKEPEGMGKTYDWEYLRPVFGGGEAGFFEDFGSGSSSPAISEGGCRCS